MYGICYHKDEQSCEHLTLFLLCFQLWLIKNGPSYSTLWLQNGHADFNSRLGSCPISWCTEAAFILKHLTQEYTTFLQNIFPLVIHNQWQTEELYLPFINLKRSVKQSGCNWMAILLDIFDHNLAQRNKPIFIHKWINTKVLLCLLTSSLVWKSLILLGKLIPETYGCNEIGLHQFHQLLKFFLSLWFLTL